MITLDAYAKINLALDVTGKRPDGYHLVSMIMQTISLKDTLTMERAEDGLTLHTNSEEIPAGEDNLIYKVCAYMLDHYRLQGGVSIDLHKRIPMAAGLAGGSSDAAAAIRGMNTLFHLELSLNEMRQIGLSFGADIPYCISGGTVHCGGIGEELTELVRLPDCFILLAKPPISISTAEAYRKLDDCRDIHHPDVQAMEGAIGGRDLGGICRQMDNVLAQVARKEYPQIQQIESLMEKAGSLRAMMSGSGPSVYGIYIDETKAQKALQTLRQSGFCKDIFLTRPIWPMESI